MIDDKGFRTGVAIVLINEKKQVFWAKRIGQNAWQFPQGGILPNESPEQAMFRELREEIGLNPQDVEIVGCSARWFNYRLPRRMVRYYSQPICIGQRQKWYLLRLIGDESRVRFDVGNTPEFDGYRWVKYWHPLRRVVAFKRRVYRLALQEFAQILFPQRGRHQMPDAREGG